MVVFCWIVDCFYWDIGLVRFTQAAFSTPGYGLPVLS
jgi:hypothetical protein